MVIILYSIIQMLKQSSEGKDAPIKVFIRVRPLISSEIGTESVAQVKDDNKTVNISDNINTIQTAFDYAFDPEVKQIDVFRKFQPYVDKVVDGFNLTVFAYGQTGSGKTYTMFGSDWENSISKTSKALRQNTLLQDISGDEDFAGITPRAIYRLFSSIENSENADMNSAKIYCSFLQIYNQKVYDLLQDTPKPRSLFIHQSKVDGIFVEGLSEFNVSHYLECLHLMKRGEKNRIIRTTSMNAKSSRSHTIFQILLESSVANQKGNFKKARLNLCDLAGSEKVNKFEAMGAEHFKELRNINQSLTTLGKVIHSLSSGSKEGVAAFRESKLTRLLQESLTSNTYTFIIGNISPSKSNLEQTLNTLKFVQRARHIIMKVKPVQFNGMNSQMVSKLQKEVLYLKQLLNLKRKGLNSQDIHIKLMSLQEQNQRLKKTTVSTNDVEKLIEENRKMKAQISKLQLNTQSHSEEAESDYQMNYSSGSKGFQDISVIATHKKGEEYSTHVDTTAEMLTGPRYYTNKRSSLVNAGNSLLNSSHSHTRSQMDQPVKIRPEVRKQKQRILGRLEQLERMQKQNESKLQKELEEIEKRQALNPPPPSIKYSKTMARQEPLGRAPKVSINYQQKIKDLEAKLFRNV